MKAGELLINSSSSKEEAQQLLLRSSPAASTKQPPLSGRWQCLPWAVPEVNAVLALIFPSVQLLGELPLGLIVQSACSAKLPR